MLKRQAEAGIRPEWAMNPEKLDEEMNKVPLFMNQLPTDFENNDVLSALQSLIYDGTPEEVAENFKNQGNEQVQLGKTHYNDAIHFYTLGIDQNCSDNKLNSMLHSNRAYVNLELGNYRKVLNDCAKAIELHEANIKAYYRSVKALQRLDKWDLAQDAAEKGLKVDPDNQALKAEREKIVKHRVQGEIERRKRQERIRRREEERNAVENAIKLKGIKTIATSDPNKSSNPYSDYYPTLDVATNTLAFPVLFLYPEQSQSDFITHFYEDTTFSDQLAEILSAPAPWDPQHNFNLDNIDIYFTTYHEEEQKRRLIKIGKKIRFGDVLKKEWCVVVNGMVEVIILAKGSEFSAKFVEEFRSRT
ncbi:hypothetical protein BKA69DRAFT_1027453 [Paraphysoderma sedebokerense]|nr:hypothetical protein BKA69DRAFT_1027453 [Paraphysoderma sedebokerense]